MKLNTGPTDRIVRGTLGLALISIGLFVVKRWLGVALAVPGALLLLSGTLGFCHVYKVLGINTAKKP